MLKKLGTVVGKEIGSAGELIAVLGQRLEFFHSVGCRVSDHALDPIVFEVGTEQEVDAAFRKALQGEPLSERE